MNPAETAPAILLVAGEASGDTHGAELIRALAQRQPQLRFIGCGGARMQAAGQEQLYNLADHAVVGLIEVIRHYPKLRRIFNQILTLAGKEHPAAVVLIDYPGFNLRLASALKRRLPHLKIIYYISPQVWAWKPGRAHAMECQLDLLLAILPFEHDWFAQHAPKLKVEWVGHPLLDRVSLPGDSQIEPGRVALLPGSRAGEIRKHLPILWTAAQQLARNDPSRRFIWLAPDEARYQLGCTIIRSLPPADFPLQSFIGYSFSHLSRCELALVASGTASLECALVGVPQVIIYKVNALTYRVAKYFVKLRYISLVNLLARREVVPELVQRDLTPHRVIEAAEKILTQPTVREKMRRQLAEVVLQLGSPGASERAAAAILKII